MVSAEQADQALAIRVTRSSLHLLAARLVTAIAGLVSVSVLYDRLGREGFGIWALMSSAIAIAALTDLGLGSAQIRAVAQALDDDGKRRARAVLGLGLVWPCCLVVLCLAGISVGWHWLARALHLGALEGPAHDALLLLLAGFLLDALSTPWQAMLEGNQLYALVAAITGGAALFGAGLLVTTALRGGGLVALASCTVATSAVRAVSLAAAARRHSGLVPRIGRFRRADLAGTFSYGSRVQVTNAAAAVNGELDRITAGVVFTPAAVAGLDPGIRLVGLLRLPTAIVLTALFPAASAAARDAPDRLDRLYFGATRYLAVFAAIGAAALVVAADPLVRLWLGHPVPLAALTVAILAPGLACNLASGAVAVVTRAEGRPGRETRYALLAAGLNLILTIPFLLWLGPYGAPLSSTLVVFVSTAYFFAHFHADSGRPLATVLRAGWAPVVAALVAVTVTYVLVPWLPDGPGRLGAAAAAGCRMGLTVLVAVAVLVLLRFFDATDRALLRGLISARPDRSTVTASCREETR